MNRGDIKLIVDRCIAYDVPDAADLIESLVQQLANKDVTHLAERVILLEQELADLTHDFTALGQQYIELMDLLKEKDDLLRQIAIRLEQR